LKNGNEIQELSYKQLVYLGDIDGIIKNKVKNRLKFHFKEKLYKQY